jgi:MscS family membrane protein
MDIVNESGTGFAFPSQTLYFGRNGGLNPERTEKAEAEIRQWRDEGRLRQIAVDPPPGEKMH